MAGKDIELDSMGRVILEDEALRELETAFVPTAGAGPTLNEICHGTGTNISCDNFLNCSGSTNANCTNDVTCVVGGGGSKRQL
jgi:hypothetical protein